MRAILICVPGALALSACGAGPADRGDAPRTLPSAPPSEGRPADPRAIPETVPLQADGPADPGQTRVIRAWARALREGDVARAASYWAVPSRAQNGTPVLTLRSEADTRAFNRALPCGAVLTRSGGACAYTITTVRLTQRPGADCGSGAGGSARNAIRVRDGKIVEWYRLPEDPGDGRGGPERAPVPDAERGPLV
ncbi:MAG: hypothetical protein H0T43_03850 [Solirubrobacterales bacterium]|nr:hypothetical protein [Solirubrobacterales bacterium]